MRTDAKRKNNLRPERLFMENKSSGKTRFNIVDLLIILLVLAVAAALVYAAVAKDRLSSADDSRVTYILRISNVKEDYVDFLKSGSTLFDSSSGVELGIIKSITAVNSKFVSKTVPSADAEAAVVSEYEDEFDLLITLTVTADVDSRGIASVGGNKILVGSKFYVRSGAFAEEAFCTGFSIEE